MLTYIQINAGKPREKAYSLSDSQGLHLAIQPNGSKLWRLKYRFLDKQKKLHLAGWPTIRLADARIRHDDAKKQVAARIDRTEVRHVGKENEGTCRIRWCATHNK